MAVEKRHKYVGDCCCNDKKPSRKNANSLEAKVTPEADDIIVLVRDSDNAGYKITYGDFIKGISVDGGSMTDTDTTYTLTKDGDTIILTDSNGVSQEITITGGAPEVTSDVIADILGGMN